VRKSLIQRTLLIVAIASLSFGILAGCAANNEGSKESGTSSSKPSATNGEPAKEPTQLTVFLPSRVSDTMNSSEMSVFGQLEKRMNVKFEFITGTNDEMTEKFKLMIASGKYPDIVAGPFSELNKYGMQGAFVPLNELIKEHAPNITKYLMDDEKKRLAASAFDNNLYAVPLQTALRTSEGYVIRKDWLDRLDLPVPVTIDDWYTVLKAFKEQDANGNGDLNDEIPLATDYVFNMNFAEAWGIDLNPWYGLWFEEDNTLKFSPTDPRAKEFLTTMNKWYSEGLLDKEFATKKDPDLEKLIFSNTMGAGAHWVGYLAAFNGNDEAVKHEGFNFQVVDPPVLNKGDKPFTYRSQPAIQTHSWAISSQNQHVEETIKLFDYVYSDEGQTLLNFGVEGEDYTVEGDSYKYTDKILKNPDGIYNALWRIGAHPQLGFRQDVRFERAATATEDIQRQLFYYQDNEMIKDPLPPLRYTEEEAAKFAEVATPIHTYVAEMLNKFIIGTEKLDKFDKFVETIKSMNLDAYEKLQLDAYQRYLDTK
jgi:putative aldouronate transport system substrate-binding protein